MDHNTNRPGFASRNCKVRSCNYLCEHTVPSHSPRPQVPAAPLPLMMGWTQHMWNSQNSATHPPTQLHAGFGNHTGKPHSPELSPPYLPRASLYITPDIKTKQGKSAWTGSLHTQRASPCAFTRHHVIETLNFLGPKSGAISCSKVNAVSHTARSTRLLPTASKHQKVAEPFFLPSKYKIIIKE